MTLGKNRTMAVTGAAGFIGRHLIDLLIQQGYKVRALLHRTRLPQHLERSGDIEKFSGSILENEKMTEFLKGVDTLFHLATALGNKIISDDTFFAVNRDGTESVLRAAAAQRVRKVVHFSSAGVYGKSSGVIPLKETDPLNPIDIYERTKLAGEQAALAFSDKTDVSVIRPGWVYGEGDRRTFKLIRQIQKGPFFIAGSGRIRHSPIYVRDLVSAALGIAHEGKGGEIYNVAHEVLSVEEMVRTISDVLGTKILPFKIPIFFVYPPAYLMGKVFGLFKREAPLNPARLAFFLRGKPLDSEKIKDQFGFVPATPFKEGMERTIAWYRQEGWL